jgi:GNAT superfamily N-acetyltransferase
MEIRPAESDDRERIRAIAHDSLRSSYSLSPQQIETIVEEAFSDSTLAERLDDSNTVLLVADHTVEETEEVLGFIDVEIGTEATIRWLHVDPDARGEGIATALIERSREEADGVPLAARVLEDAVEGGAFLEGFGLERDGNDQIEVGGEEFAVTLFTEGEGTDTSNEPAVTVPESITVDGADRFVDRDEAIPGREAPFFSVSSEADGEDPYGYFCSQCGSTNVSADGLDRLECGNCGNVHLADEWDDAYL